MDMMLDDNEDLVPLGPDGADHNGKGNDVEGIDMRLGDEEELEI